MSAPAHPLLPAESSRSDELESPLEPMHLVTGTFERPEFERVFRAAAFRLAFSTHLTLMVCFVLVLSAHTLLGEAFSVAVLLYCTAVLLGGVLGIALRLVAHRMEDHHQARRFGGRAWTAFWVMQVVVDAGLLLSDPASLCELYASSSTEGVGQAAFAAMVLVVLNNTHGLGFWHKTALVGLQIADDMLVLCVCLLQSTGREAAHAARRSAVVTMAMVLIASVAAYVFSHFLELQLRHNYRQHERLKAIVGASQQREEEAATALHGMELMMQRMHLDFLQQRGARRARASSRNDSGRQFAEQAEQQYDCAREQLRNAGVRAGHEHEARIAAQQVSTQTAERLRWGGGGPLRCGWTVSRPWNSLGRVEEAAQEEERQAGGEAGTPGPGRA